MSGNLSFLAVEVPLFPSELEVTGGGLLLCEGIVSWCEANNINTALGFAKSERLIKQIKNKLEQAG